MKIIELDLYRHKQALINWIEDCKLRMNLKFHDINFDAECWPIKTLHQTDQADLHHSTGFAYFKSKDESFCNTLRGLTAEMIIEGKPKSTHAPIQAFCWLAQVEIKNIFEITLNNMRRIEDLILKKSRENPAAAIRIGHHLSMLKSQLELLAHKGVIPNLGYRPSLAVKAELRKIHLNYEKTKNTSDRSSDLDRKIECFNDALNALYEEDQRLSAVDRVAIALSTRLMCAPSRVNEVLCSSIDDHVTVEDYTQMPSGTEQDVLHRAHQMLLITMKGSKGASWSAKPALNFMIHAFHYTTEVILKQGKRSRMLVEWYQQHPDTLYLPLELEYLRGSDLRVSDVARIVNMTKSPSKSCMNNTHHLYASLFEGRQTQDSKKRGVVVPFKDAEQFLLEKVHVAMEDCRKVTYLNHYEGDLSKMLFLCDRDEKPYLPWAVNVQSISRRLAGLVSAKEPNLFQKLGITMPQDGKVIFGRIETHDPRRWLTTQALRHGESLSDVLINKWTNRLKLAQLKAYDLRSDVEIASSSKMPVVHELVDISVGVEKVYKLEEKYGLKTQIVTVPDANISITSMDLVVQAVEDRPVARTSEQIIVLYPSQYGVCMHQHYETPCRNYDSCLPCNSGIVVKGHLPSNEKVRIRAQLLYKAIIRQMEKLVLEHNRGIADEPESLAQHILHLAEKGLDPEKMADYLIDEFHEIKDMIKDMLFAKRLEEAFVGRGFVKLLDDKEIPDGALMKYHNPGYHAAPTLEKALDSHGGREQIIQAEQALIQKHPQFAPKALHLKDERHLLAANGEDFEE